MDQLYSGWGGGIGGGGWGRGKDFNKVLANTYQVTPERGFPSIFAAKLNLAFHSFFYELLPRH